MYLYNPCFSIFSKVKQEDIPNKEVWMQDNCAINARFKKKIYNTFHSIANKSNCQGIICINLPKDTTPT